MSLALTVKALRNHHQEPHEKREASVWLFVGEQRVRVMVKHLVSGGHLRSELLFDAPPEVRILRGTLCDDAGNVTERAA